MIDLTNIITILGKLISKTISLGYFFYFYYLKSRKSEYSVEYEYFSVYLGASIEVISLYFSFGSS
jgi:hypothetical protein